jgi:hypothetical protein
MVNYWPEVHYNFRPPKSTATMNAVSFKDAVQLSQNSPTTLRRDIDAGRITPIRKGVPIKRRGDLFSYPQVAALIRVGALREFVGLSTDNVKTMMEQFMEAEPEDHIASEAATQTASPGPGEARPKKQAAAATNANGNQKRRATVQQRLFPPAMLDAIASRYHALLLHYKANVLDKQDADGDAEGKAKTLRFAQK